MTPRIATRSLCSVCSQRQSQNTYQYVSVIAPRSLRSRQLSRRFQSTSSSQSSKICSVPFKLQPAPAAHKLHMNALIATAKLSNLFYAGLLKLFGPGISMVAKEFGFGEGLELKDMKAIYWPIWRCDLLLEGKVEGKGKEKEDSKAWVSVREGYIPGNSFAPLSYLSFAVPPISDDISRFNPHKDLQQLGDYEIVPVPFNVSPFAFFKKLRRSVGKRGKYEEMTIDESQWKEIMAACYPMMFPIYVAEFEHKHSEGSRRFSIVMDAHDANPNNCRASWPPPPEIFNTGRFTSNYYVNPAPFLPISNFLVPMVVPSSSGPPISPTLLNDLYTSYISPAPTSASSIPPSPLHDITDDPVNFDDLRIQSWTSTERDENIDYHENSMEYWKGLGALQGIEELGKQLKDGADPPGLIVNLGRGGGNSRRKAGETAEGGGEGEGESGEEQGKGIMSMVEPKPMSEIKKQMQLDVEKLKVEWDMSKPGWLKKFENGEKGEKKESTTVEKK